MYCRNCGTRLENDDLFCSQCGEKIKKQNGIYFNSLKKKIKKEKKSLTIIFFILIILLVGININKYFFSEESVIIKYIKSYVNNDYNKVVMLSGISEDDFINKHNIQEKYGDKHNNKIIIKNITSNTNKGEHTRTITYLLNGYNNSTNVTIKSSGKKFFLFNNYVVTSNNLTANNVYFIVPSDAKLTVDNVVLSKKYIFSSKDGTTTYKVEKLLKKNVKITLQLKNGLVLTDVKSVFNNEEINYTELNYNLDNQNIIKNISKEAIDKIITSAIRDSDYSNIKESNLFSDDLKNNSVFEDGYSKIKDRYRDSIKEFSINSVEIKNIKLDSSNNISVNINVKYSYKDKNNDIHETSRGFPITLNDKLVISEFYLANILYIF